MKSQSQKLDCILAKPRQDHIDFLLQCSRLGPDGIRHWNQFRTDHPTQPMWLEQYDFSGVFLEEANLDHTHIMGSRFENAFTHQAVISNQELYGFILDCSNKGNTVEWNLWRIKHQDLEIQLHNANLEQADLQNADFHNARFNNACFTEANLNQANFDQATLNQANLVRTGLQAVAFNNADLRDACLRESKIQKALFVNTQLENTNFRFALTDEDTTFSNCRLDRYTDTTGIDLDLIDITPELKRKLQDNLHRQKRDYWYSEHPILKALLCK